MDLKSNSIKTKIKHKAAGQTHQRKKNKRKQNTFNCKRGARDWVIDT